MKMEIDRMEIEQDSGIEIKYTRYPWIKRSNCSIFYEKNK